MINTCPGSTWWSHGTETHTRGVSPSVFQIEGIHTTQSRRCNEKLKLNLILYIYLHISAIQKSKSAFKDWMDPGNTSPAIWLTAVQVLIAVLTLKPWKIGSAESYPDKAWMGWSECAGEDFNLVLACSVFHFLQWFWSNLASLSNAMRESLEFTWVTT